jgi:hypothetical protein
MPWYAPVIVAVLGILMLLASRQAEPWMAASQARAQQVFGTGEPPPGSRGAGMLTLSRKYAKWFLRLAAVYLLLGALVMTIIVVA